MNSNENQKDSIRHGDLNLHLHSCAGSGKTEVVAPRVAKMLTTGLRPSNLVVFTFADKAAAEFKKRIIARCQKAIDEISGKAEIHIGSIHAFCLELLTAEVPKCPEFDELDEVLQTLFIDRQSKKSNLTPSTDFVGQPLKRYKDPSHYLSAICMFREVDTDDHAL